ncbi:paramyosin-like [Bolinopsis microptera]|uniref:paramyosin-like n=1 Tax=Bolinopsis microptera TaxID=2820187 RepID=UPI003079E8BB
MILSAGLRDHGEELEDKDRPLHMTLYDPEQHTEGYPRIYIESRYLDKDNKSLQSTSKTSLKSNGSKVFAYSVSSNKTTPEPDQSLSSDNTESAKFITLSNNVHEVEALFTMNDKKLIQGKQSEAELRQKFKNLVVAFEEEKHSKDKLRLKRDKMKAQLKEATEALLEAQMDNGELIKHLKDEESQKQFYQVECTSLKDEIELLKRKLHVLESLEKERREKVDEDADSTGLLRLESQLSMDCEMNYKTLYDGMSTRHQEMEGIMSGTIERMKMELSDLKLENLGLQTKNCELSEKVEVLEPKWKEKTKELDNIHEMIEALNMQIVEVQEKCSQGLCVSGQQLEKELKEKDDIMNTLQSQLSKSRMKRKELNNAMATLEKQVSEMENSRNKADEKYIELVKEAEQLKCKLVDRDELCNSGCCSSGMKSVSKDSETKYIVKNREDTITTLSAKVEKLTGKKDELRKELAVYKMEMINNENITKETERLNRKLTNELASLKEEITMSRRRCEDGSCRSGSAKESELLAETRAELNIRRKECQEFVEEIADNRRKLSELCRTRDDLKTKVSDLEAMLEKTKTHSRLLTNETVSLSTQLADMERKLEVETSKREDSEQKDVQATAIDTVEKHDKLLPISRTSSQVSSLSDFMQQISGGTEKEENSVPESDELSEARKKISRQKEKIKNLKTEYLNLKDLKREDYTSLQGLLRTTLENCKELERKVKSQSAALEVAKVKGWAVTVEPPSEYREEGLRGEQKQFGYNKQTRVQLDENIQQNSPRRQSMLTRSESWDKLLLPPEILQVPQVVTNFKPGHNRNPSELSHVFSHNETQLLEELEYLEHANKSLENEVENLIMSEKSLQRKLRDAKLELEMLIERVETVKSEKKAVEIERDKQKKSSKKQKKKIRELQKKKDDIEKELKMYEELQTIRRQEFEMLQLPKSGYTSPKSTSEADEPITPSPSSTKSRVNLTGSLQTFKNQAAVLEEKIDEQRGEIAEKDRTIKRLTNKINEHGEPQEIIRALNLELKETKDQCSKLKGELKEGRKAEEYLLTDLERHKQQLNELQECQKSSIDSLSSMEIEVRETKEKLDVNI